MAETHNRRDRCPEVVINTGVYQELIQKYTNAQTRPFITTTQLIERIDRLWQHCPTPSVLLFPKSFQKVIKYWLEIDKECSKIQNQLEQNRDTHLKWLIDELTDQSSTSSEVVFIPAHAKRSSLNSILTDYPLYSTLLFIESEADETLRQWWLWFLFRLNKVMSGIEYHLSLEFDTIRRTCKTTPSLPIENLKLSSNLELARLSRNIPELQSLSHHFLHRPKKTKSHHPFKSDNEYIEHLALSNEQAVSVHTPVDVNGDDKSTFFQFEGNSNATDLLSHAQCKRKYQLKRVGVENAIARANRTLPLSNNALTTSEFAPWLQSHCPAFFDNHLQSISKHERAHWFLFFLRLLTGHSGHDFALSNIAAKENNQPGIKSIHYKLNTKESCDAFIRLSTHLFKGKAAPLGAKHYYSNDDVFDIDLPWPLNSLLNLILRQLTTDKRHNTLVYEALATTPKAHEQWLRKQIKDTKHTTPFKITPSTIYSSFDYYAAQSLPSVIKDYLQQQGSVLMHYVNMETRNVSQLLYQTWFQFLKHCGLAQDADWSSESRVDGILTQTHHQQMGSAITLREGLLPKIFKEILKPVQVLVLSSNDKVELSQRITLYLHIRSAVELAIRPVTEPYPSSLHCSWKTGLMVVQDKRTHHNEEHRLLFMSKPLSEVLSTYQEFCSKLDPIYNQSLRPCLATFNGVDWVSLNAKNIQHLMKTYLESFDTGSFRHICAHQITELALSPNHHFEQQQLNQKMNHHKRGQNALGKHSLCSIKQSIKHQRNLHETLIQESPSLDTRQAWEAIKHWDDIIMTIMRGYQPRKPYE